jgi:hypothetical protein
MQKLFLPLAALAVLVAPMAANAAACRDAHGRFIACAKTSGGAAAKPAAVHAKAKPQKAAPHVAKANSSVTPAKAPAKRCKIGNKFAKCGTPGAKPV